jgi:hypothetical protein
VAHEALQVVAARARRHTTRPRREQDEHKSLHACYRLSAAWTTAFRRAETTAGRLLDDWPGGATQPGRRSRACIEGPRSYAPSPQHAKLLADWPPGSAEICGKERVSSRPAAVACAVTATLRPAVFCSSGCVVGDEQMDIHSDGRDGRRW